MWNLVLPKLFGSWNSRYVSFVVYGRMSSSHLVVTEFPRKMFFVPIFMACVYYKYGYLWSIASKSQLHRAILSKYFRKFAESLQHVFFLRCLYIQNNRPPTRASAQICDLWWFICPTQHVSGSGLSMIDYKFDGWKAPEKLPQPNPRNPSTFSDDDWGV